MLVAALAALALGVAASPAAAQTSCGRQIIEDWTDVDSPGIDRAYPLHCYHEAIAAVPEDLEVYTGIVDDIISARKQAARSRTLQSSNPTRPSAARKANKPDRALFARGFDKLGARNVDTVPLPLLILAGLSLLLIAAGAAGLVARRIRSTRGRTRPAA